MSDNFQQKWGQFSEDLNKVIGNTLSMASGMRKELGDLIRQQMESVLNSMQLVRREEFEIVQAMVKKLRLEQEELKAQLAEAGIVLKEQKSAKPAKKPATKTSKSKKTS